MSQAFSNGQIFLAPKSMATEEKEYGIGQTLTFSIIDIGKNQHAGEISLRCGESVSLYYLGHIGYHIDKSFQGNAYAYQACLLLLPLLRVMKLHSLVITCDIDNYASRRTCEKLGCDLERIVKVPDDIKRQFVMHDKKCRYIWQID